MKHVGQAVVLAIHDRQIAEHGGLNGVRDFATLESSLARPLNLALYELGSDIAALAASYAFGIAAKQAFFDGNERTSAVVTRTFLRLNGYDFVAAATEAVRLGIWTQIGSGELTEEQLAEWMRANIAKA